MYYFIRLCVVYFCFLNFSFLFAAAPSRLAHPDFQEISESEIQKAIEKIKPHPRLFLNAERMEQVRQKIEKDPCWNSYYRSLKACGDDLLKQPLLERKMEGRRLLGISRAAISRIFVWSFLWEYEKDPQYFHRAEKEMLNIAQFFDWNPSHFLDVAEMTTALAIGYDTFYSQLSSENRKIIRDAIYEKGLLPATKSQNPHWLKNRANWNQVCNGGIGLGALAICEDKPSYTRDLIQRCVNGITWSMSSYEPDGNYTEGPGYWGYGTSFNILFLEGLRSALGTDFGRSDSKGFLASIHYYEHVFGSSGEAYNYPDSGGGRIFEPTVFWYSEKLNDPSVSWNESMRLITEYGKTDSSSKKLVGDFSRLVRHRLSTAALLWGPSLSGVSLVPPKELGYIGVGDKRCPVVLCRTSWTDPNAAYLGIKAGSPQSPHGHMDVGGFVYDKNGVRWAVELGAENYHKIESRGMNLWGSDQGSDRWKLFRYNNFGHNTLVINEKLQLAKGKTHFDQTRIAGPGGDSSTSIDLTPVYKEEIASVVRNVRLAANGSLNIVDSLTALPGKKAAIQWRMITPAKVGIKAPDLFVLTQIDPKSPSKKRKTLTLYVKVKSSCPFTLSTAPAQTDKDYDSPNPGKSLLLVDLLLPEDQKTDLDITLTDINEN